LKSVNEYKSSGAKNTSLLTALSSVLWFPEIITSLIYTFLPGITLKFTDARLFSLSFLISYFTCVYAYPKSAKLI